MRSRLISLEMVVSFNEWFEDVAVPNNYDKRINAFLNQYPSKLSDFNPKQAQHSAYCCPRSWEFMNSLLQNKPILVDDDIPLFAGTISPGVATEFVTYSQIFDKLPKYEDIIKDPNNFPIPENMSEQWATIAHLSEKATDKTISKVFDYISRFKLPMVIMAYKTLACNYGEWFDSLEGQKYTVHFVEYLYGND